MTVNLDHLKSQYALLGYCREKRAELNALEANAKSAIQAALGDDDTGTIGGRTAVTWKVIRRNSLNQQLLKNLHPEVFNECVTVSESRRFEVSEDL